MREPPYPAEKAGCEVGYAEGGEYAARHTDETYDSGGFGTLTTKARETENSVEGETVKVLAAVEDLLFRSRISEAADSLGVEAKFPRSPEKLLGALRSGRPDVLVLDLNSVRFDAVSILNELRADEGLASVETIGYVPHTRTDLILAAREAGCGRILARSAFFNGLPDVLLPKEPGGSRQEVGAEDEL